MKCDDRTKEAELNERETSIFEELFDLVDAGCTIVEACECIKDEYDLSDKDIDFFMSLYV